MTIAKGARGNIDDHATRKFTHRPGNGITVTVWLFASGGTWQYGACCRAPGWGTWSIQSWGGPKAWPNQYNAHLAALVDLRRCVLRQTRPLLRPTRVLDDLRRLADCWSWA